MLVSINWVEKRQRENTIRKKRVLKRREKERAKKKRGRYRKRGKEREREENEFTKEA